MDWAPGNLEWLQSRRGQAYEELRSALSEQARLYAEIARLHRLVIQFDSLIAKEEACAASLEKPKPRPAPAPRAAKPRPPRRKPVQASEPLKPRPPAERRGLIPPETEEERALRLPPPELPVPVVEAEEEKPSGHLIADDIDRSGAALVQHGYRCFGRRRSRRYEGLGR